jgi:hypothetical protein
MLHHRRILIFPASNTLSHVAQALAINLRDMLDRRAGFAAPLQRIAQCLAGCDALESIARCAGNLP